MRAAIYARVSTVDQHVDMQVVEIERLIQAKGWVARGPYVDHGAGGGTMHRAALRRLMDDARARRFDVVVAWRLDRLGRSLRDLVLLLDDLERFGVRVVTVHDGIDLTSAAGRLTMHLLAAMAEFERSAIRERVTSGIAAARSRGVKFGRPKVHTITARQLAAVKDLPLSAAAKRLGVSKSLVHKLRKEH